MSVDIFAEQHSLRPRLSREVALPLLHRDLTRRRLAGRAGLRPDHLDREKIAGDEQSLLGDGIEREGFQGDFYGCFHRELAGVWISLKVLSSCEIEESKNLHAVISQTDAHRHCGSFGVLRYPAVGRIS